MVSGRFIVFPPFRLDVGNRRLWHGSRQIHLRPKIFALLQYFTERPRQIVRKDELLKALWPGTIVSEKGLKAYIRELRKLLQDDGRSPRFIETVHGAGYRWVAPLPASQPVRGQEAGAQNPPHPARIVVGRETAVAQMHGWLAEALRGERHIVFVSGEPGIGKTTLIEAFLEQIAGDDLWVTQGQCVEQYGAGEAYLPMLSALDRLCRTSGGEQLLVQLRQHAPMWLVQLTSFLSLEERKELQYQLFGVAPERMLWQMGSLITALTAERGLVLVLEDLHWSDAATLGLVSYLAQQREPAKLLVIGTYRPQEVLTDKHPLRALYQEIVGRGYGTELPLENLGQAAVEEYLAKRFPHSVWPTHLAQVLYERTEGNPLFMVAMLDDLLAQGLMALGDDKEVPALTTATTPAGVPERLRQLVAKQIEKLSLADRRMLEAASVAGLKFSAAEVAAVLAVDLVQVEERCEELVRRQQFLQPAGFSEWPDGTVAARYEFRHALYQYLWQERVKAGRWRLWHRRLGERKEVGYGERAGEIAAELAVHFEQGREYARAVYYLRRAGATANARYAHQEAIGYLTRGLELLTLIPSTATRDQHELQLQIALGASLTATKGYAAPEVGHVYTRAQELCRDLGEAPLLSVLFGQWRFALQCGELPTARALAEQCLSLTQRVPDPVRLLRGHITLGVTLYYLGELAAARTHLEQAIALYGPQGHRSRPGVQDPVVACLAYSAWALWHLGYPEQALRRSHEALARAHEVAQPYSVATALFFAAEVHYLRREVEATQEQAAAALTLAEAQGFPFWASQSRCLLGWALAERGQPQEGLMQMQEGLAIYYASGAELGLPYWLSLPAAAYGKRGQPEEGLRMLTEALRVANKTGEQLHSAELYRLQGACLLAQSAQRGKAQAARLEAEAELAFQHAIALARRQEAKSFELRATLSLSHLWQAQGRAAEAYAQLKAIYEWFTEGFDTKDLQAAQTLLLELEPEVRKKTTER